MKIKTFKIKVESNHQTFDFSDFFEENNKVLQITPTLVKEKNSYYWHVFAIYERRSSSYSKKEEKELNPDFQKEVTAIISNKELNMSTRVRHCINYYIVDIQDYEKIGDFLKMRYFGKKGLESNKDVLLQILEIAKKYRDK